MALICYHNHEDNCSPDSDLVLYHKASLKVIVILQNLTTTLTVIIVKNMIMILVLTIMMMNVV